MRPPCSMTTATQSRAAASPTAPAPRQRAWPRQWTHASRAAPPSRTSGAHLSHGALRNDLSPLVRRAQEMLATDSNSRSTCAAPIQQCPLLSAHAAGGGGGQTTRSSGFRHRGGLGATGRRRRPSRWRAAAAGRAAAPLRASLACIGTTTGGGRGEITAAGLPAGAHLHQIRPCAVCAEHQTDGNCSHAHTNEIPVQEGEAF